MKVCLYLELESIIGRGGIGVALKSQKKALETAGIEYTTNPRDDYDVLHINTIFPMSLAYAKLAKDQGKKVIMHAHTLEEDTRNSLPFFNNVSHLFRKYLTYYYGLADHIITPSEYAKERLIAYGVKKPITPISNGVNLKKFQFDEKGREEYRKRYNLDDIVPFSVGNVFMRKGVKTFMNVARSYKNNFIWFGNLYDTSLIMGSELKKAIEKKPDNVQFTGFVDNIISAYSAGDIFFFPSTAETQGIVILEAWAMGKPVLIRDLEVYKGWTHDGKNCLKAKDDEDFKKKLKILMDDEALRKKLAKAGSEEVKKHSMEKVAAKLKGLYEEVLNED